MAFWKESMINRLSNLINRNRLAAKISQVLCSNGYATCNDKKGQCAENVHCSNQQMTITGEPAEPYGGKQI